MRYKAVHTGANNQLGGLNEGLLAIRYQPFTPELVKNPANAPTISGIAMEMINFIV